MRLTPKKAFRLLLNDEDYLYVFIKAGYTKEFRRELLRRLKKDNISDRYMEKILVKCGFLVAQEKLYYTPQL